MMFTTHTEWTKFWVSIWNDCDDDPGKIAEIEGVIFQKKNGDWVMAVIAPNSNEPMVVKVDYNPWSGEELPALSKRDEEIARKKRVEIWDKIHRLTSDMHGYEMAHHNSSSRSEKVRWTKRIKAVKTELAQLGKQRTELG